MISRACGNPGQSRRNFLDLKIVGLLLSLDLQTPIYVASDSGSLN